MKQTVTENMFIDSFTGGYKDNFSYEGKKALFEWLEQYEDDCDTELELDPIALCCEFTEFASIEEFQSDRYDEFPDTCQWCGEGVIETGKSIEEGGWNCPDCGQSLHKYPDIESIQEETQVIEFGNCSFIIQDF